jgi:hypothetical protein
MALCVPKTSSKAPCPLRARTGSSETSHCISFWSAMPKPYRGAGPAEYHRAAGDPRIWLHQPGADRRRGRHYRRPRPHTQNSLRLNLAFSLPVSAIGLFLRRLPIRVQRLVFERPGCRLRLRTPRLGRLKPCFDHGLGLAPGGLVDAPGGDLLDEEVAHRPDQRIDPVW